MQDYCTSEVLVLFGSTVVIIKIATQDDDPCEEHVRAEFQLATDFVCFSTNFKAMKAPQKNRRTTRDKFMSSGVLKTDTVE